MRRIWFGNKNKSGDVLHIETPLAIINIRVNLFSKTDEEVNSVEIIPNNDCWIDGNVYNRIVRAKYT